eukprot:CAMPEP_0201283100 /NCGR_PEP_ID=MMETSP1317-20130820/7602_1 /ASSEMBLY_ACC=CAM_ASM_000770 /TAXON_ID=187299 /ORGANISM="Undescribed Undescribed, Strain Undescribed" /LENGTH=367 /DNA_ID=CAMNT_0047598147 /DNA_START=137 /DNA_END=1240 /DNA_ORIENTATION=-
MTKNAEAFVGSITFEAISGFKVTTNLFDKGMDTSIIHIELAKNCDAAIIVPATANIIGKLASGIADDALSTFMLAVTAPKLVCPAMNTNMYENRSVQRNLEILEADGYIIMEPSTGELACKTTGLGRLSAPENIADRLVKAVTVKDLKGKKILVTAGPTREYMDPVRFISNPSSGKMGYSISRMAEHRGGKVVLVSGPTNLSAPVNVNFIHVTSAQEMAEAVFENAKGADVIIKAAAVSDYRPYDYSKHKIKKNKKEISLMLYPTTDILKELGHCKQKQIVAGFAAETRELEKNACDKLIRKNLDIIVGNIVGKNNKIGFEADTNKATFFFKDGSKEDLTLMSKDELANILLDRIREQLSDIREQNT